MKKYIGTKTIMAMPMAKSEAEKVLNVALLTQRVAKTVTSLNTLTATSRGHPKRRLKRLTRLPKHTSTVCASSMTYSCSVIFVS